MTGVTLKSVIADLKSHHRPRLNWAVLAVISALFAAGGTLVVSPPYMSWLGGAALAEGMILSFYLSHDCAHLSAFRTRRQNLIIGQILSYLAGGDFAAFAAYRRDHFRHHAEQADFVGVDLHAIPALRHRSIKALIEFLETFYIPAVFFVVKIETIRASPKDDWGQAVFAAAKILPLIIIAPLRPQALVWLLLAVVVRIHVIRFVDAFQHTFEHGDPAHRTGNRGWIYEQRNTFSFPLSEKFKFLNLLLLNFGYHNAHHALPHCPWYNLPRLDAALRALPQAHATTKHNFNPPRASIRSLLKTYHRHRTTRLFTNMPDSAYDENNRFSLARFKGVLSDNLLG